MEWEVLTCYTYPIGSGSVLALTLERCSMLLPASEGTIPYYLLTKRSFPEDVRLVRDRTSNISAHS